MSYIKFTFIIAAAAMISAPSVADAQSFTQRGTRGGAIAGAIIGGVIGDQRDNAFTGAVIGGLVGGAAGRAIGVRKDAQAFGGGQFHGGNQFFGGNQVFGGHPVQRHTSFYQPHQTYYGGGNNVRVIGVQDYQINPGFGGGYYGGGHPHSHGYFGSGW